jgi:hypothetical protein
MSDAPKVYTEREYQLGRRKAFEDGATCWVGEARGRASHMLPAVTMYEVRADAERKFPLPKVERPREVTDPNDRTRWRFVNGEFETFNSIGDCWHPCRTGMTYWLPTPERVEMWAALLASPTETIEDVGESRSVAGDPR